MKARFGSGLPSHRVGHLRRSRGNLAARAPQTSVSGQPRGNTTIFVNIGRLPPLSGLIDASRNSLSIKPLGRGSRQTLTEIAARIGLHKTRKAVRVGAVEPTSQAGGLARGCSSSELHRYSTAVKPPSSADQQASAQKLRKAPQATFSLALHCAATSCAKHSDCSLAALSTVACATHSSHSAAA